MENRELLDVMENCGRFLHFRRGGRWGQARIIRLIAEKGEMSQKELQDILKIQSGSLSEIIMKIEGKGYITKERDSKDKRCLILKITDSGREFLEQRNLVKAREEETMFDVLSEEEQESLREMLSRLLESWERNLTVEEFERHRKR